VQTHVLDETRDGRARALECLLQSLPRDRMSSRLKDAVELEDPVEAVHRIGL
jgi:hypothetical protein